MNAHSQEKMKITETAFNGVINHIASKPAETGGAFFGKESDYVIRRFVPDTNAVTTRSTYSIDAKYLNQVIKKLWDEEGLSLIGIVHSHPQGFALLSSPDIHYFKGLLGKLTRKKFYAPILHTVPDGGFSLYPYVLNANGTGYQKGQLEIVSDEHTSSEAVSAFISTDPERKSDIVRFSQNSFELGMLLLKCLFIGWLCYFIIRLGIPFTHFILKMLEHGTK